MRPFKFRASAALDLRRKEEDAAAAALARVEARFTEAKLASASADNALRTAQDDQARHEKRGLDMSALSWHRNWILRLRAMVDDLRSQESACALAVQEARQAWLLARRRRMTLERMRERARARHRQDEHRHELKVIDELARIRFAMPGMEKED